MDAFGDLSDDYINGNIKLVETDSFSDQLENQGNDSQI